ncbi:ABC transporter permease subunit [Oceanobacillus sp. 143]|uniref:ABC transporter permease n=1 Tax=Oceanobacillus zhaokaii TaxID=2052660 RepID=A0A345PD19_9BACI|nr:ABC transporter permease [Oceanobacillus zhaokaii]AXI07899.1 ABC transporter permease [Oceanobacillus zhaokaii]QGS67969.1 ABC transporter permease subunit [Oceanobacillus sp. 143]
MRITALTIRILKQIIRDKRTLALLIFAPILVLTMLYLVFDGDDYVPKVGLVNVPEMITEQMDLNEVELTEYSNTTEANEDLENQEIDGYVVLDEQVPAIFLEGSDPSVNSATLRWIQSAFANLQKNGNASELKVDYLHGTSEMGSFDYFGPVLLGFFVFFFVFLIAGVSFIRERTTGTLERLLSTPLRKWEIVIGYVFGFGIFTMIQSTIIAWYAIYVLEMMMEGVFIYVLIITLAIALTALTLGILISSFANNELQMIQFIPIVVIPQIFFSGLFNLETISEWLSWIGPFTPLYYAADALRDVMVRGYGWNEIYINILILIGFSVIFMFLNIIALRKYRRI